MLSSPGCCSTNPITCCKRQSLGNWPSCPSTQSGTYIHTCIYTHLCMSLCPGLSIIKIKPAAHRMSHVSYSQLEASLRGVAWSGLTPVDACHSSSFLGELPLFTPFSCCSLLHLHFLLIIITVNFSHSSCYYWIPRNYLLKFQFEPE